MVQRADRADPAACRPASAPGLGRAARPSLAVTSGSRARRTAP